jgi:hypothetical protein
MTSNFTFDRTAGSRSLAAAGQRARSTTFSGQFDRGTKSYAATHTR